MGAGGYSTKFYTGRPFSEDQTLTLLYNVFDSKGNHFVNGTPLTHLPGRGTASLFERFRKAPLNAPSGCSLPVYCIRGSRGRGISHGATSQPAYNLLLKNILFTGCAVINLFLNGKDKSRLFSSSIFRSLKIGGE